jgi:hypothetical protein
VAGGRERGAREMELGRSLAFEEAVGPTREGCCDAGIAKKGSEAGKEGRKVGCIV